MESSLLLLLLLLFWCRPSTMNWRKRTTSSARERERRPVTETAKSAAGLLSMCPSLFCLYFYFIHLVVWIFFFLEIRLFDQFFFSSFFSFFSAVGFVDRERGNNSNTLLAFYIWRRLRRCGRFCDLFSFGLAWTGVVFCDDKRDIAFDRRTRSLIAASFIIFVGFIFSFSILLCSSLSDQSYLAEIARSYPLAKDFLFLVFSVSSAFF